MKSNSIIQRVKIHGISNLINHGKKMINYIVTSFLVGLKLIQIFFGNGKVQFIQSNKGGWRDLLVLTGVFGQGLKGMFINGHLVFQ